MIYAGHLPTQRFTRDEFNAMPIVSADDDCWPPEGYSRYYDRAGKAVVYYMPDECILHDGRLCGTYAVRPVIRVPSR